MHVLGNRIKRIDKREDTFGFKSGYTRNMSERNLSAPVIMLEGYISEISESRWAAGWMHNIEFDLWEQVTGRTEFARTLVSEEELEVLKWLAVQIDGWVRWTGGTERVEFVPLIDILPSLK